MKDAQERDHKRAGDKTRKSALTRRRIMINASKLMVERGSTSFLMSEVSDLCFMSKGALYYYFEDREDLIQAIFDEAIADLVDAIDNAVSRSETADKALRAVCSEYASRVSAGSPLALALMNELICDRKRSSNDENVSLKHIVDVVADLLEKGKDEGVVRRDVDAQLAAISVCGGFAFAAVEAYDGNGSTDVFTSSLLRLIVDGIGPQQD